MGSEHEKGSLISSFSGKALPQVREGEKAVVGSEREGGNLSRRKKACKSSKGKLLSKILFSERRKEAYAFLQKRIKTWAGCLLPKGGSLPLFEEILAIDGE